MRAALEARGFETVGECSTIGTALAQAGALRPDICLVDAELLGGVHASATAIGSFEAESRVVVLAQTATPEEVLVALDAGAAGYLLKDVNSGRLSDHLRDVFAGHVAISPVLVADVLGRDRARRPAVYTLTAREQEVMSLLTMRLTTKQVAQRLGLSPTTVRRHVSSAVQKLGVRNRSAAIGVYRAFKRRRVAGSASPWNDESPAAAGLSLPSGRS